MTACAKRHFVRDVYEGWSRPRRHNWIPQSSGMYAVFGASGECIYVGSSNNVRRRLMSYATMKRGKHDEHAAIILAWLKGNGGDVRVWFGRDFGPWYGQHLHREARLIRRLRPKCNVMHRDSVLNQMAKRNGLMQEAA